ncbi:unnamed protein product [Citrullus colocynthis]|uniref:Uncharacterized protein n=1 Tax=Citrullus colocynthis TaxID=252529 RepID=A0ABP0YZS7_9ROSI
MPSGHKCENGTNVDKLDNRVIGLVEVNAWSLGEPFRNQSEPFSNQSSFISKYRAISSTLDFKNPFVANKGLIRIMGNKIPSVITHLGFKFLGHGIVPNRNGSNISKSCGLSLGPVNEATGVGVDGSGDKGESPSDKDRGREDVANRLDGSVDGVHKGV